MVNSRKIEDLLVPVQNRCKRMLDACHKAGIELIVTSTYRDFESQTALYAIGRTKPGKKVTNAKAGRSYHNWRVAFDVMPLRAGKPVWGTTGVDGELWQRIGEIGKKCGLDWAGDWKTFKEFPHFQFTGGLTLTDFNKGKTIRIV